MKCVFCGADGALFGPAELPYPTRGFWNCKKCGRLCLEYKRGLNSRMPVGEFDAGDVVREYRDSTVVVEVPFGFLFASEDEEVPT